MDESYAARCCCLKKNMNAPRPSGHPPVRGVVTGVVSHVRPTGLDVVGYQSHLLQRCHPTCGH